MQISTLGGEKNSGKMADNKKNV
ncbi:hypothetical protein [Plasmodium yoelii yoelii]|uniref:Uncharacterized protein n=1 Tax=Plasmodium yoelii yoelii TaxID=73239 RepID=Q7RIJ8_PLAYO|nr:hypothetical protein [Plasmodium yoelii yoelii]